MENKILKDIRYYESNWPNISGQSAPANLGKIFKLLDVDSVSIGQRIARKLNELNFISGSFDHIYINFTTLLNENEIEISNRITEKWIQYINYGLDPIKFNSISIEDKYNSIFENTIKCLNYLYSNNKINLKLIEFVKNEILKYRSEIQIKYKSKITKSYSIDIFYQIKPNNCNSCFTINYTDKQGSKFINKIDLEFFDDIYFLIDTISVKDGMIILNPKKSYKAKLYNKRYKVPICIKIV